jgi:glucose-6-phosphate 1-epimerase
MIWQSTGAQLLSLDSPVFYLSPLLKPESPARGGVPVLFPQFADKGPLQKHGYARNMPWVLDREVLLDHAHLVQFCLEVSKTTWPAWPYAARLELKIDHQFQKIAFGKSLTRSLEMSLAVRNTGEEPFEFTGGLHPYFAISKPEQFKLNGLEGCPIIDKLNSTLYYESTEGPALNGDELERLYLKAPPVRIEGGPLGTLVLCTTGFNNWMVWNPGVELAKTIADLPNEDWARFVCVEPVIVDKPVHLQVGETFTGTMRVELI